MPKILIIYSSKDGQTLKICQTLQRLLESLACEVTVVSIDGAASIALDDFDKIVLGASIHYGQHNPQVPAFIAKHQALLAQKPSAFFSVNLVARKPEKRNAQTNPYLKKFLKQITWQPKYLAVFAGKIDYPSYTSFDRSVIRLIMWMTKGPTDPTTVREFTDWDEVESFAHVISNMR